MKIILFEKVSSSESNYREKSMTKTQETRRLIREQQQELAEAIMARHYDQRPELWESFGESGQKECLKDINYHLSYLTEAMTISDTTLFTEYIAWAKSLFASLGFSEDTLSKTLTYMHNVLEERLPEDMHHIVHQYIEAGLDQLQKTSEAPSSFICEHEPLSSLAAEYLEALLAGERHVASQLIMEAVNEGTPVKQIYLHVFQPVQREVGRLWQTNQVSVAQEHYCTAATQMVMSQLYPRIFSTERSGRRLVATCVGDELHEIGVRMVADFFEMEGWDTYYLGANSPTKSIVNTIEEQKADILAISVTITMNVSQVTDMIEQVRESEAGEDIKIIVGGYPFNVAPDLWREVGADGYARDAQEAISVANAFFSRDS